MRRTTCPLAVRFLAYVVIGLVIALAPAAPARAALTLELMVPPDFGLDALMVDDVIPFAVAVHGLEAAEVRSLTTEVLFDPQVFEVTYLEAGGPPFLPSFFTGTVDAESIVGDYQLPNEMLPMTSLTDSATFFYFDLRVIGRGIGSISFGPVHVVGTESEGIQLEIENAASLSYVSGGVVPEISSLATWLGLVTSIGLVVCPRWAGQRRN